MTPSNNFLHHFILLQEPIVPKFILIAQVEIMGAGLRTHVLKSPCDERLRHTVMTSSFQIKTLVKDIKLAIHSLCQFLLFFLFRVISY